MALENLKGTKDYYGADQEIREFIKEILSIKFRTYGFKPLETPIIELFEILASKYAGGSEILKEIYTLKDRGNRELALRYDLTVPLSRFIGMNPTLKMPVRRYEIGKVFRDGPVKAGRLREFTQCDADIIGVYSMRAEAEILAMAFDIFNSLKLEVYAKANNIKIIKGILKALGVNREVMDRAILAIDKLDKLGESAVKNELLTLGVKEKTIKELFKIIGEDILNPKSLNFLESKFSNKDIEQGLKEMKELISNLEDFRVKNEVKISLSLARGLEYYTGTIFEFFSKSGNFKSSLAAGGRYDKMIGKFLGSGREFPAVGISFGLDAILEALKEDNKIMAINKEKDRNFVYIIPIKTEKECVGILQNLRNEGICAEMDLLDRSLSKNLEYANRIGAKYVVILGKKELEEKKLKLKDMETGKEEMLEIEKAIEKLKGKKFHTDM